MTYWPGSNIRKSKNNAFDWQTTAQGLFTKAELASLQANVKSKMSTEVRPTIPTFTKAAPKPFTNR